MTASGGGSGLARACFVLGVALGGFFDGILLHQVLQWHHLLSLVPGEDLRRVEVQIFWDGAFHVLMYGVALVGLWMLWRARDGFAEDGSGRRVLLWLLLGFAGWNAVDVIGFHWIARIHRIRVDVPVDDRLRWDLLWLGLFSVLPLLAAGALARRRGGGRGGPLAPAAVALLVSGSGLLGLRAPANADARAVLFRPGLHQQEVFAAVMAADGRVVRTFGERLVVVQLPEGSGGWRLYRHGALAVGGPGSPAACLNWVKT
jgi:uncharacterized membrane protein